MEKELKAETRKKIILIGIFDIIMSLIILVMIFAGIFASKDIFYFTAMLYIFIFLVIVIMIYVTRKLIFINKANFTYGKIIKVEKNSPSKQSDVYQNFIIEYTDESTNKTCKTIVYEHFGDNDKEYEKEIQDFYSSGQKILGKNVPILYIKNNPNKTLVFLKKIE